MNHTNESSVSWNVMIAVYVNNSMPAKLYLRMETCRMKPDAITFSSVLPASGDLAALLVGKQNNRSMNMLNLSLENALIDMYAKCESVGAARRKVFDGRCRDVDHGL